MMYRNRVSQFFEKGNSMNPCMIPVPVTFPNTVEGEFQRKNFEHWRKLMKQPVLPRTESSAPPRRSLGDIHRHRTSDRARESKFWY